MPRGPALDAPRLRPAAVRRGFTLVEILVTVTIIGILVAIAIPIIGRVREHARGATCKSNLRQLAQGMIDYAVRHDTYCSGNFDWKLDGAVTEVGWVADLVGNGVKASDLACGNTLYPLSKTYHQLLHADPDPAASPCTDMLGKPSMTLLDGSTIDNVCRQLEGKSPDQRAPLINSLVYEEGYNTNYVATWFLVRSEVRIDDSGNIDNQKPGCPTSLLERGCTHGPLNQAFADSSPVPTHLIPIFACGGNADGAELLLGTQVGPFNGGTILAENVTYGPVETTTFEPPTFGSGTTRADYQHTWQATLQDYRSFGPVHGGKSGACNVAFLDGHVETFVDTTGDGLLNNGFPGVGGYDSDIIELPEARIYSGWSLEEARLYK